jgi:LacI family transcriptional regulator
MGKRGSRQTRSSARPRVLMALGYYDQQLHRGIVRYARQAHWILDTSMAHYGVIPEHWQGDGIITLLLPSRQDIVDYVRRQNVSIVSLTTDIDGIRVPRVRLDNQTIGRMAAQHLLDRGFKNLAFFKFSDIRDVVEREEGFRKAVRRAGGTYTRFDWNTAFDAHSQQNTFEWMKACLCELVLPVGVMAQSDNRAALLVNACEAIGVSIPEQVAIIGVDNDEYACEFASVPISSVDSNREMLAYEGAALLGRLMNGARPPRRPTTVTPKGVVVRKSSDILAIDHKAVAKALSFIWENFQADINVDDVIQNSHMSRCGMYRAFEKHVGRSIGEELIRKRIEHAKKLLMESGDKLHRVAYESGFSGGEHFSRAFTRVVGITPSEFRQKNRSG